MCSHMEVYFVCCIFCGCRTFICNVLMMHEFPNTSVHHLYVMFRLSIVNMSDADCSLCEQDDGIDYIPSVSGCLGTELVSSDTDNSTDISVRPDNFPAFNSLK